MPSAATPAYPIYKTEARVGSFLPEPQQGPPPGGVTPSQHTLGDSGKGVAAALSHRGALGLPWSTGSHFRVSDCFMQNNQALGRQLAVQRSQAPAGQCWREPPGAQALEKQPWWANERGLLGSCHSGHLLFPKGTQAAFRSGGGISAQPQDGR